MISFRSPRTTIRDHNLYKRKLIPGMCIVSVSGFMMSRVETAAIPAAVGIKLITSQIISLGGLIWFHSKDLVLTFFLDLKLFSKFL